MAGHNKWSKVKRLKGALDAKRGKIFSKLAKEIVVAVKMGGGDPATNPRLRAAIQAGRGQNMPNDNIERAIKKGSGEDASSVMEEITYEGYAPGGVAFIIETATDNKNRTAADLRSIFSKNDGNLAASGSVSYLFSRKGAIILPKACATEDRMLEAVLEADGEELVSDGEHHTIYTAPDALYAVAENLKQAGFTAESQELIYLPGTLVQVTEEKIAQQILRLYDTLDDNDDVLKIYANFDIADEILSKLQGS